METKSISSLAELSDEQRRAVESLMGHPLDPNDMVLLLVGQKDREPTAAEKMEARARLQDVFERVDRFGHEHEISPDEADAAIDEAVREVRSRAS